MNRRRWWFWISLFVAIVLLLTLLATGWNVVLVRDYFRMVELARQTLNPAVTPPLELPPVHEIATESPWTNVALGSSGFAVVLAAVVLFFLKMVKEMRLNQQQSEFLATVSHELKTPIAAMELSASLLRQGGLTGEEATQLWESHEMELKRLRAEVEELLEAARWQTGGMKLARTPMVLEEWIEENMARRWRSILGPGARLTREGEALSEPALLDVRSLNLIVDNLFDNARKFARGTPAMTIHTRRHRGRWHIEFRDEGWGFDPSDSKRLFVRFFRARHDAPYAIPGTGLGLFLAASACRALGLKLRGTSEGRGYGAVFTLSGREIRRRAADRTASNEALA